MPKRTAKESGAKTAKTDKNTNPKCFFDITIDGQFIGRIIMELNVNLSFLIIFIEIS